ncbi:serine hydrolase domain-containing protein [Notoacmeibacter marinus]|uniref:serine hydrolase domain-containing protein n=1 Tax=Notoacmeibacter marinus TaxID=1876515 RepID=UPI000DF1DB5A|nr:serine hydrolase [Notoacmeibacter marinus]
MRLFAKIGLVLTVLLLAGIAFVAIRPPDLLRIGGAYVAKITCSSVFVANRDRQEVVDVDIFAPENPLLNLVRVSIDDDAQTVSAAILGFVAERIAVHRPGYGCTVLNRQTAQTLKDRPMPPRLSIERDDVAAEWPAGERVGSNIDPAISALLNDDELAGEGMRALIVVKNGRIVAERYAETIRPGTPLIGWSMTKSVTAILTGLMADRGLVSYDQDNLFESWEGDARAAITLGDLSAMVPSLRWDEGYATVSDVTRMLYLRGDMAGFVAEQSLVPGARPGDIWEYSTGFSVALITALMNASDNRDEALSMPDRLLFEPLGITTATLELDEADHFAGGSYLYMAPRDWARIGWLLADRGRWNGRQLLSQRALKWLWEPVPQSNGEYRQGSIWRVGDGQMGDNTPAPSNGTFPDLPDDTAWMLGHDGQSMAIVPSEELVILRMGLTPSSRNYRPQHLVTRIIGALDD